MQTQPLLPSQPVASSNGLPSSRPRPRYTRTLQPHEHAHLARFLENYLNEHHCSTSELAHQLTISANYLNSMKSARNLRLGQAPTYRIVNLMAARLGLPVEDLLGPPLLPPEPEAPPAGQELCASITTPISDRGEILMSAMVYELRMLREALDRNLNIQAGSDSTPLDYLHRYWRLVSGGDRLRFLTEMLTPNERRALQFGFEDEELTP